MGLVVTINKRNFILNENGSAVAELVPDKTPSRKTQKPYRVSCQIDLDAVTPLEAARTFQKWLQEPGSNWVFTVKEKGNPLAKPVTIDLDNAGLHILAPNTPTAKKFSRRR
jgi:hypothetical protein